MSEVVVLGAGPAGLMAALEAAKAGHRCTVYEAGARVGGMAGSFELAGQRVDYGSHRLHTATPPALRKLIEQLLGSDLQIRPRAGRLRLDGRWVDFPLRAGNLLSTLTPRFTGKLLADSIIASTRRRDIPSPSFDDVVGARFGPTVANRFYGPYAMKLYGLPPRELDGELARRRISADSPTAIVRRLARARQPEGRTFLYPKRGYGQIVERLADAAQDAGADIRLGTPVGAVRIDGRAVIVSAGRNDHRADVALSTLPLPALAGMLRPTPPTGVIEALSRVRTRAMILVYLVVDRPQYTPFDAHYLPDLDTTVARLSEPKNYRDGDDPPDRTVLCAEIACWPTDDLWRWPAERLAELVVADLRRVGLPSVNPVEVEIRKLPSVYPVYDLAGAGDRAVIERWTRTTGPVLTLGRQGLRAIDNLHHVLGMGVAAIEAIGPDGKVDAPAWHRSLERFAANVVED